MERESIGKEDAVSFHGSSGTGKVACEGGRACAGRRRFLGIVLGGGVALILLPMAGLLAGQGLEIEGGDRTVVSNGIVFNRDIQEPVFKTTCAIARCHDSESREHELSFDTWEDIAKGGEDGPIFIPGEADKSELMLRLSGKKKPPMPLKKKALSRETQQKISQWIESGVLQLKATLGEKPVSPQWIVLPDTFGVVSSTGLFTPNIDEGKGIIIAKHKSATDSIRVSVVRTES
jgi:hypothetical protein